MACAWCRKKIEQTKRGRPRRYCGRTCRQKAYEMRGLAREYPGRTKRAIGTLKSRERAVRDARNAMIEAKIGIQWALERELAELWRDVCASVRRGARRRNLRGIQVVGWPSPPHQHATLKPHSFLLVFES
jgi:hypothetical protein